MTAADLKPLLDFEALSADYARYHTHPYNRLCHVVGIPAIMLAVVRWTQLRWLPLFPLAALALPLYLLWNPGLAAAMTLVLLAMAAAAVFMSPWTALAVFVVGWIFQLLGHWVFEKKSPAFAKNLVHLLVGPMWILREVLSGADPAK